MSARKKISEIRELVTRARVAWFNERPRIADPQSAEEFHRSLRGWYAYHREAKGELERIRDSILSMIEDCEIEMYEAQRTAEDLNTSKVPHEGDHN